MLILTFVGLILQVIAGLLFIWSYDLVTKGKNFINIAGTASIFGIIGTLLIGLTCLNLGRITPLYIINWIMFTVYVIVIVLTLMWRKK